jgi:hypothetical protein
MDREVILLCGHPNPLGCPNHGDIAREIWRSGPAGMVVRVRIDPDVPIPYVLNCACAQAVMSERGVHEHGCILFGLG